ncbi:hypothetical protein BH24ACT5_BH24ACT5_02790 [soil metagenome]
MAPLIDTLRDSTHAHLAAAATEDEPWLVTLAVHLAPTHSSSIDAAVEQVLADVAGYRHRWAVTGPLALGDAATDIDQANGRALLTIAINHTIGERLHAHFDGDELDVALYRLVGDLARLAHLTADAVAVLAGGLDRLADGGRLHHDDTRRPVPTSAIVDTRASLERARGALGPAGDVLDEAHNVVSHFYETDPVLRVVPDPDPPVGERWAIPTWG